VNLAVLLLNRCLGYRRDILPFSIGYNHPFVLLLVGLTEGLFLCPAFTPLRKTLVTLDVLIKVHLSLILPLYALI
jgi:hypothetical protein